MVELHELDALSQARLVAAGAVSAVELTEHLLTRAERLDPLVGAFLARTPELALRQAAAADRAVAEGAPLSPLHGVAVPVKDLNAVAGQPQTFGSLALRDNVAATDDNVVARLKAAGTVCLGKTNTPEFGLPAYTEGRLGPPARTPWDLTRSAGGSSGGAAAAVASRIAPLAHGSDGGGSIRIPASACGLVGLKTSRGRVSPGPSSVDLAGLAVHGPIGRTVPDVAALLDVMAGPWPGDPHWAAPLPEGQSFLAAAGRDPDRARVARFATPVLADVDVDPQCLRAWEQASSLLDELGHEVIDIDPPFDRGVITAFETVWACLACLAPVPAERQDLLMPLTRWLQERGALTSAREYLVAMVRLHAAARSAALALAGVDAVLTPTLARLPMPVGGLRDDADPAADFAAQEAFTPWTSLWNVTGQPAISLPLHWTEPTPSAPRGLPVGVMLAGRPAGEAALLSLAGQLERARPWAQRTPELPE